jgi:hypothetical protein
LVFGLFGGSRIDDLSDIKTCATIIRMCFCGKSDCFIGWTGGSRYCFCRAICFTSRIDKFHSTHTKEIVLYNTVGISSLSIGGLSCSTSAVSPQIHVAIKHPHFAFLVNMPIRLPTSLIVARKNINNGKEVVDSCNGTSFLHQGNRKAETSSDPLTYNIHITES